MEETKALRMIDDTEELQSVYYSVDICERLENSIGKPIEGRKF